MPRFVNSSSPSVASVLVSIFATPFSLHRSPVPLLFSPSLKRVQVSQLSACSLPVFFFILRRSSTSSFCVAQQGAFLTLFVVGLALRRPLSFEVALTPPIARPKYSSFRPPLLSFCGFLVCFVGAHRGSPSSSLLWSLPSVLFPTCVALPFRFPLVVVRQYPADFSATCGPSTTSCSLRHLVQPHPTILSLASSWAALPFRFRRATVVHHHPSLFFTTCGPSPSVCPSHCLLVVHRQLLFSPPRVVPHRPAVLPACPFLRDVSSRNGFRLLQLLWWLGLLGDNWVS